jgi:hypothetical protein
LHAEPVLHSGSSSCRNIFNWLTGLPRETAFPWLWIGVIAPANDHQECPLLRDSATLSGGKKKGRL